MEEYLPQILELLQNPYVQALLILLGTIIVLKIIEKVVFNTVKLRAVNTENDIDDLIADVFRKLNFPLYFFIGIRLGTATLELSEKADLAIRAVTLTVIYFYVVRILITIFDYFVEKMVAKGETSDPTVDEQVVRFVAKLFRFSIWFIAGIILAANLGYDVSVLIAGLGIGGIAVGFALKDILADLFAYFAIFLDKPFMVGDFVKFGDKKGTVENIGIKSTRLRTPDGEELVAGNRHLTEQELHNYGRLERRRSAFEIGVIYNTSIEKLREIPQIIEQIYSDYDGVTLDRVHFKTFGDSALIFEIVHFVESKDYVDYMNVGQTINLRIAERFKEEGIEFAFPTQTIYMEKD